MTTQVQNILLDLVNSEITEQNKSYLYLRHQRTLDSDERLCGLEDEELSSQLTQLDISLKLLRQAKVELKNVIING